MRILILILLLPIYCKGQTRVWEKGDVFIDFTIDRIVTYQDGLYTIRGTYEIRNDTLFISPDYARIIREAQLPEDLPLGVYKIPFKQRCKRITVKLLSDGSVVRIGRWGYKYADLSTL